MRPQHSFTQGTLSAHHVAGTVLDTPRNKAQAVPDKALKLLKYEEGHIFEMP